MSYGSESDNTHDNGVTDVSLKLVIWSDSEVLALNHGYIYKRKYVKHTDIHNFFD